MVVPPQDNSQVLEVVEAKLILRWSMGTIPRKNLFSILLSKKMKRIWFRKAISKLKSQLSPKSVEKK
jgi:hypothetical protein